MSVLDPGGKDIVNRPEEDWPLPQTRYEKLYLDGQSMTLSSTPLPRESAVRYQADDRQGNAVFTYRFAKDTELVGYPKMHLWVEADGCRRYRPLRLSEPSWTRTATSSWPR